MHLLQEAPPEALTTVKSLLLWLGGTSLTGATAFYLAWLALTPKLTILTVIDKSKKFNSESRLQIKNIGRLHAWNIRAEIDNAEIEFGSGFGVKSDSMRLSPNNTHLIYNEVSEIPILSTLVNSAPVHIKKCNFVLNLRYDVRFLFFKKELRRKWAIELRNFGDSFTWNVSLV